MRSNFSSLAKAKLTWKQDSTSLQARHLISCSFKLEGHTTSAYSRVYSASERNLMLFTNFTLCQICHCFKHTINSYNDWKIMPCGASCKKSHDLKNAQFVNSLLANKAQKNVWSLNIPALMDWNLAFHSASKIRVTLK